MIHPGSGGREKCWPIESFLALAETLVSPCSPGETASEPGGLAPRSRPQHEPRITWLLGPAECERFPEMLPTLTRRSRERGEGLLVAPGLEQLPELLAAADVYVGNDAGMTHLAAAVGAPTVAVFGPTDPAIWRPLGAHVTVVSPPSHPRIADITVHQVAAALRAQLDGV